MMKRTIFYLLFSLLFSVFGFSQGHHVRVAFIGNSITIATGLTNPTVEGYPYRVDKMLQSIYGDTCIVKNFAVSGRTMLKDGDFPIWNEPQFGQMWNFAPDIVYIMLGTNDSKPYNWGDTLNAPAPGNNYDKFFADYMSMIDTMKVRNPRTKFIVALPPPAYCVKFDIRDSIIANCVIPIVDSIHTLVGAEMVDYYTAFADSSSLFPDCIHPNAQGHLDMAKIVYNKIIESNIIHKVETGYTFVTGITTANRIVAQGDSVTLSWTSINADSVFFDGKKVALNGSIGVSTVEKNLFMVYAYGAKGIDSMMFTQPVYVPALTKLGINTKSVKMNQNDSAKFELLFYDQQTKLLTGKSYDVTWTIREGGGYLTEKTNNSVVFVGSEIGKSVVVATVGNLSIEAKVSVAAKVGVTHVNNNFENRFFHYPSEAILTFEVETNFIKPLEIRIFDIKGALQYKEVFSVSKEGIQTIGIKTDKLKSGIYLFEVEGKDLKFNGKFRQQ